MLESNKSKYPEYELVTVFNKQGLDFAKLVTKEAYPELRDKLIQESKDPQHAPFFDAGSKAMCVLDVVLHLNAISKTIHILPAIYIQVFSDMIELGLLSE